MAWRAPAPQRSATFAAASRGHTRKPAHRVPEKILVNTAIDIQIPGQLNRKPNPRILNAGKKTPTRGWPTVLRTPYYFERLIRVADGIMKPGCARCRL